MNDKLTGYDYITRDFLELEGHPDFNIYAYQIAVMISSMTTEQLETIELCNLINSKTAEIGE